MKKLITGFTALLLSTNLMAGACDGKTISITGMGAPEFEYTITLTKGSFNGRNGVKTVMGKTGNFSKIVDFFTVYSEKGSKGYIEGLATFYAQSPSYGPILKVPFKLKNYLFKCSINANSTDVVGGYVVNVDKSQSLTLTTASK